MAGAIFQVTVPATIIRSACRGDGLNASMPNREMSKRDMALAIISNAQHASPNERGHTADLRPQLTRVSMEVMARLRCRSSGISRTGSGNASVWVALRSLTTPPSVLSRSHVVV